MLKYGQKQYPKNTKRDQYVARCLNMGLQSALTQDGKVKIASTLEVNDIWMSQAVYASQFLVRVQ